MRQAGQEVKEAPVADPENLLAFRVWNLVADQVTFYEKGKAIMKNEGVCPVIALLNLSSDESLELLDKIKIMRRIYNGENIDIDEVLNG